MFAQTYGQSVTPSWLHIEQAYSEGKFTVVPRAESDSNQSTKENNVFKLIVS